MVWIFSYCTFFSRFLKGSFLSLFSPARVKFENRVLGDECAATLTALLHQLWFRLVLGGRRHAIGK